MKFRNKSSNQSHAQGGFTLIELLVVVAIIALLSSIALIALISARQKSRNAKRLSEMTQMNSALELYFTYNKGYPDDGTASGTPTGIPTGITPQFAARIPTDPTPPDGNCLGSSYPTTPNPTPATRYYYVPKGTPQVINGLTVYPDYNYYFCLGSKTGDFDAGVRVVTPTGVK